MTEHYEYRLAHPTNPRRCWTRGTDLDEILRKKREADAPYREDGRIERREVSDWEPMRDCDIEFGEHEHDDEECGRTLAGMEGDLPDPGWSDSTYDNLNTSGSIGFSVPS